MKHNSASPITPQRIVILGATGFLARDLVRELAQAGIPVKTISASEIDLSASGAGVQLAQQLRNGDALVVTSALTPDKGKDVATFMKNMAMVANVSGAVETGRCSHVLYISSDAVYDDGPSPIRESTPAAAPSLYGVMHYAREKMLEHAVSKPKTPLCIVRPCAVDGPGDTHNANGPNRFLRTALSERKIKVFGQGEEQRDHIYIEDLSSLLRLCLLHRSEGVLNAVTGHAVSFGDLAKRIAELAGGGVQIAGQPRATPITHRHFDVSERLKLFPEFKTIPLEEGLRKMLNSLKQNPA